MSPKPQHCTTIWWILSVNQAYDKSAKNEMHESVKLKDVEYDAMKPIYQNLSAMVVPCCTVKKKAKMIVLISREGCGIKN